MPEDRIRHEDLTVGDAENSSKNEVLNKKYTLSRGWVIFLFIYYAMLIINGLVISSYVLLNVTKEDSWNIVLHAVIVAFAMSTMLSAVRYTRVLYIACIHDLIMEKIHLHRQIGNVIYFLSRPLFAMVFSIVAVVAILGGFFIVTGGLDCFINEKFLYLVAIVSCMVGISGGKTLDKFRDLSDDRINRL